MASTSYVYAIGKIEARFPNAWVEKELVQATARGDTAGLTDRQSLQKILSEPQNRYLVRELCWVMMIQGVETYILVPRDPADFSLLVAALRARPEETDLDLVIGVRGPIASPEMCNGLLVPIVVIDHAYSFSRKELIDAIPRPEKPMKEFAAAAKEVFDRMVMQITDNAGATDETRALGFLAMRYHRIYTCAAEAFGRNASLSAIEVRPSPLNGARKMMQVIFSFEDRNTGATEKYAAIVDVTGKYPYLDKALSPHFKVEI